MNPQLERLLALQLQDTEARRLREALAEAPKRIAAAEAILAKSEANVAAAQTALKKEEVLRRSQESDATTHRGKIARLEKQMETATSATQITALEHEIAFARAAIAKLEDEELASMERTETLETQLAKSVNATAHNKHALDALRQRTRDEVAADTTSLATAEAKRKALRPTVDEALLSNYDRIAKARGTGLSEAVDHKCSACQMMLRPQRWNDLVGRDFRDSIFTCESCGRMLWYDPRRDAPTSWRPGDITEPPAGETTAAA